MMGIMQEEKSPQMDNPTKVVLASQGSENTSKFESRNFSARPFSTLVPINNDVETKSLNFLFVWRVDSWSRGIVAS